MSGHISLHAFFRAVINFNLEFHSFKGTFRSNSSYKSLNGFKSGLWDRQKNNDMLVSLKNLLTIFAVCFGSLSC